MDSTALLGDAFGRVQEEVHGVVAGLSPDHLNSRTDPGANSIAWLVWHLTRVQDDHVADVSGLEQVWTAQDWAGRFELPLAAEETGYGHSRKQAGQVRVASGDLLLGYYDAVHEQTVQYLKDLQDADLDRVVDDSWTPAVTLGVRLVSVLGDDMQHIGQAAFVRGALERH